ncbi:MAG TPA: TIGR01777 family oxidoreductase [Bacillota bacterium]
MNVLLTGGTGFVGQHVIRALHDYNIHTYILTRFPEKHDNTERETFIGYDISPQKLPPIHTVINLAGESLFGYWTKNKKKKIVKSRIKATEHVLHIVQQLRKKPEVFISGSAVGFYGMSENLIFTEDTETPGDDYLANVVVKWERAASLAEALGIRTIYARFGVVLGNEGALPLMSIPIRCFIGGKVGTGEQWMSWVHIEDVVKMIVWCIFNRNVKGPVNVVAPNPKRNKEFTEMMANILKRPTWLAAPSPFVYFLTGEMSQLILKGQYVLPKKAMDYQFEFTYPHLEAALKSSL